MTPAALPSRIDAVTVYRSGARVTRVAELAPDGGTFPPAVRFAGLPLALDDSSVRARVDAIEGGDPPVAFDLRVALDVPEIDERLQPADDATLESARAEVERLEGVVSQIEKELARLDSLELVPRPRGPRGKAPPPTPAAARRALIRFRADRERALGEELRAARLELDAAERRQAELEDQSRRASGARQAREHELRKAVVVSLRGGGGARCRLVVEYLVPGATWAPIYAVRLEDGLTAASLSVRAAVAQASGEDWSQVALTLSTAAAQGWTELPELPSLRIGRLQPSPPRVGWRPPPTGTEELYRDWDRAFAQRFGGRDLPEAAATFDMAEAFDEDETMVERKVTIPVPVRSAARPSPTTLAPPHAQSISPPPPPMQMMAPIPVMSPASMPPKTKSAGLFSRAAPAPEMAKKSRQRRSDTAPGGFVVDALARPKPAAEMATSLAAEPTELVAAGDLLRYGDLRMAPASSARRGHLQPAGRVEVYLELLVEQRVSVRMDLLTQVTTAQERAARVAPLPPGCRQAWSDTFDYAYPAEVKVDVPSDGDFHSIPLEERAAASTPSYVVVPRESTDVFRTAVVENPLDAPLLPGPVDVYLRGEFLLTSRVDTTSPRGRLTLGLGVEQGIKVARNAHYREESAGLMGGALVLQHQINVELKNNLGHAAQVEVRERVPVAAAGDDDVEVKVTAAAPKWEEWRQEPSGPGDPELRGGHRWRVTVAAGGRQELRADYEVRISSKHELVGGNRREI